MRDITQTYSGLLHYMTRSVLRFNTHLLARPYGIQTVVIKDYTASPCYYGLRYNQQNEFAPFHGSEQETMQHRMLPDRQGCPVPVAHQDPAF